MGDLNYLLKCNLFHALINNNILRVKEIMSDSSKGIERRADKRLGLSLPITLLGHKVKSKNIGSGGVYFEETADNIEEYSLGKTTTIKIVTSVSTHGLPGKTVRLTGVGMIMRIVKIDINHNGKKFGVALKFSEKLKLNI